MAAPLWDALSKVATIAQLSGIDVCMLIVVGERLLRISCNRRARDELEKYVTDLHEMLHQLEPYNSSEIMLRHSHMWDSAVRTVKAAEKLLDEYRRSTLWDRVRAGRDMSVRLGKMNGRAKSSHSSVKRLHDEVLHPDTTSLPPLALDTAIAIDIDQVNRAQDLTQPYYPTGEGTSHDQNVNYIDQEGGGVGSQPDHTVGPEFELVVITTNA